MEAGRLTRPSASHNTYTFISVVMVSGGREVRGGKPQASVELISSNGTKLCSLPKLPAGRDKHTQNGLLTCGARGSSADRKSCVTFSGGKWKKTHTLRKGRIDHSSWDSPKGVFLMGGVGQAQTTELLTDDGGAKPSFTLDIRRK